MSRGPSSFKQRDLVRALKAAKAAGCGVHRIAIEGTGRIVLETVEPAGAPDRNADGRNEWDDVQ
jgi:hypothetical protein